MRLRMPVVLVGHAERVAGVRGTSNSLADGNGDVVSRGVA
jgi:hypothetical protein